MNHIIMYAVAVNENAVSDSQMLTAVSISNVLSEAL